MATEAWLRCTGCGHEDLDEHFDDHLVTFGTRMTPPEYVAWCPRCGAIDDGLNTVIKPFTRAYCYYCEEEQVADENEMCPRCAEEIAESLVDSANGH